MACRPQESVSGLKSEVDMYLAEISEVTAAYNETQASNCGPWEV